LYTRYIFVWPTHMHAPTHSHKHSFKVIQFRKDACEGNFYRLVSTLINETMTCYFQEISLNTRKQGLIILKSSRGHKILLLGALTRQT